MTPAIDKLLFAAASGFASSEDRLAFLSYACRGDDARLKRLEELLEIQRDADEFFEFQPAMKNPEGAADEESENGGVGARIGPYRLIDRLGSGGCGVVYLAEQKAPVKRKVALKIIRLGMDTENVIARFNLEREALALMNHTNIARVLDAGATASGRPYFVMELVDGEKITDFCDCKQLGIRKRLELFILVCEAIQHAHQKGVVHRDIKPSNILVREEDGRMVPKVIDFGIAKATAGGPAADVTVTASGQLIGTPAYMSPEQAEGGVDIDTRSDIYSLGVLLCELLTGLLPLGFDHLGRLGVEEIRNLLRHAQSGVPSLRLRDLPQDELGEIASQRGADAQRLPNQLAGDLDWIVMKAMEKERHRRYETAYGLAMDVQRYLREEPVLASPPSRRYLLGKLVRRNRVIFAAASVALFGLLGGFGVSTWLFYRERDARQEQARLRLVAEQATANEVRLREAAKVADQVRQAAVYLRYNDLAQADELLEGVPTDGVPRSLEASETFMKVANWNLSKERFDIAAKRFHALGQVLTSVDMTDSERISFDFLSAITAVSQWGEPGQYDRLRELAISRFANSANPVVAEHVIKATLLQPADPVTLARVAPLAKVLDTCLAGPQEGKSPHMIAWRQFSLALMAYRQGELETAANLAHRSLATASNSEPRTVSNQVILAMVDLKQGRTEQARASLEALRDKVDQWLEGPFQVVNPDGTLWYNQWAVDVLLKEAGRLLEKSVS